MDWRDNQPDSIERTLVLLCWSFFNDEKSYLWGKDKEQLMLDLTQKFIVDGNHNLSIRDRYQKYLASNHPIQLVSISKYSAPRINTRNTNIIAYNLLNENDVVYYDPPYLNSIHRYGGLDDNRFSKWLNNLPTHNIFISERHIFPHTEVFKDLGTK